MSIAGKKVLVTGADGFIGSHLVERLLDKGCAVRALSYYNSFNRWGWLDTLPKETLREIEVVTGDVRDATGMRNAMRGVSHVFHLAALIGIPYSYVNPDSYVATNVSGTLNVLQAAREQGAEKILVTSTSEVYGTALTVPIDEDHPLQPQSPYAATKVAADALALSFQKSFELPVVIVRPFNTYGPRQSARAVIPAIITQLLGGAAEIKLGSLHPTRDLTFVTDTCDGFLALAECSQAGGLAVNLGNGREIAIGDLAQMLIQEVNPAARIVADEQRVRPGASEVERLLADSSLMQSLTGWRPQITIGDGLRRTVEWLRDPDNRREYKGDIYNV